MIKFKCNNDYALTPTLATDGSAGFDLHADSDAYLSPGLVEKIFTGVTVAIPAGYVGVIHARSGYSLKYGMQILAGVIDSDYRGEVVVLATSMTPFEISYGERIAQLVVVPCLRAHEVVDSLDETERGSGGFGSTGR